MRKRCHAKAEEYSEDAVRAARVEGSASSLALPPLEEQRRLIALMIERPRQVREAKTARARVFELMPKEASGKLQAINASSPLCEAIVPMKLALVLAQNEALVELGQPALAAQELELTLQRKDLGHVLRPLSLPVLAAPKRRWATSARR